MSDDTTRQVRLDVLSRDAERSHRHGLDEFAQVLHPQFTTHGAVGAATWVCFTRRRDGKVHENWDHPGACLQVGAEAVAAERAGRRVASGT